MHGSEFTNFEAFIRAVVFLRAMIISMTITISMVTVLMCHENWLLTNNMVIK
jgi:hypothetical protein